MLFMMDTQWAHVKGSDYLKVLRHNLLSLLTKEAKDLLNQHFKDESEYVLQSFVDENYVNRLNEFVKKTRSYYDTIITSFNQFETDVERNEITFYRTNSLEHLSTIKNQRQIECFVDTKYIDYVGYEYLQRENQKLIDLVATHDIIDCCGLSMCGQTNEIINMEWIVANVLKSNKRIQYRLIKDLIADYEHNLHRLNEVAMYDVRVITERQILERII